MKIRCPRCNEFVSFTRKDLQEDQRYVTTCVECGKNFAVRVKRKCEDEDAEHPVVALLSVIENEFCHRQVFKIREGSYTIGRMNKGTNIEVPIDTGDMMMDRRHCVLSCSMESGNLSFQIYDSQSVQGTFVNNQKIGNHARVNIDFDDVVTLGLTSIILKQAEE